MLIQAIRQLQSLSQEVGKRQEDGLKELREELAELRRDVGVTQNTTASHNPTRKRLSSSMSFGRRRTSWSVAPEDEAMAEEQLRLSRLRRAREAASSRTKQESEQVTGRPTTPSAIHSLQVSIEGSELHLNI